MEPYFDQKNFEDSLKQALLRCDQSQGAPLSPTLSRAMEYSLLGSGKRIRPRLVYACSQAMDLPLSVVDPIAVSLEMVHCFTLIHDDLPCMDNADTRRGMPSNHKKFGEAFALLAGDNLLIYAFQNLLHARTGNSEIDAKLQCEALLNLSQALGSRGVIGGQAAEIELESGASLNELKAIHGGKTGALFLACIDLPRVFAQIPSDSKLGQTLLQVGQKIGSAFQIADDLEDAAEESFEPDQESILNYLSAENAQELGKKEISEAMQLIEKTDFTETFALLKIGKEIEEKLNRCFI